jgi:regulator of RNase E activity RraA
MSFQAYIDNIKAKTGVTPDGFRKLAEQKGFMQNGELNYLIRYGGIVVKPGDIIEAGSIGIAVVRCEFA